MSSPAATPGAIFKWLVDVRGAWPEAQRTKDLPLVAGRALALLTAAEEASVLRFYHLLDAKMALASALLKRLAISRHAGLDWEAARWTRDQDTKPVFRRAGLDRGADGGEASAEVLLFNVSHQAGLVVLVGWPAAPPGSAVGIDVVCPMERRARDHAMLAGVDNPSGWAGFVATHEEVLAPAEAARLRSLPWPDADRRLAYFYALWCLREAYVKMTGDALLAPWLRQLELRHFAPPGDPDARRPVEIRLGGRPVVDVELRLRRLLRDFVVCTAVRRRPAAETSSLQRDERLQLDDEVERLQLDDEVEKLQQDDEKEKLQQYDTEENLQLDDEEQTLDGRCPRAAPDEARADDDSDDADFVHWTMDQLVVAAEARRSQDGAPVERR